MEGPRGHRGRRLHGLSRRDDRQRRLPGHRARLRGGLAGRPVLGAQRVQHRLRGAAGPGRPGGRPASGGGGCSSSASPRSWPRRSLCGVAASPEGLVAARVLQAAAGASWCRPRSALLLPEFPAERRATAVGDLERDRRRRRGARAVARRRAGRPARLALGLLRQRADRPGRAGAGAADPARGARRRTRVLPDALGSALLVAGVGALALGIVKGSDWGWDSARVLGAARRGRGRCCRRSWCARRATPRR